MRYYGPSFGIPITMNITKKEQEMRNIWINVQLLTCVLWQACLPYGVWIESPYNKKLYIYMLYKLTHNNNNISVINWDKRKPHFGPSTNNYTPPITHTLKHNFKISNFLTCILT
jgi:hypothetical protein